MLKRSELILKVVCLGLAALLVFQFSRFATHKAPLANWSIPELPSLPPAANAQPPAIAAAGVPAPRGATPAKAAPPAIQTRVDRITASEILGPVMRPLPMALLGLAGEEALLRGPNGQTGLVKEGGEVGGIKLLRIGTNRVLIEHEGKQKELTIFSGYGSETLLPQRKESTQ